MTPRRLACKSKPLDSPNIASLANRFVSLPAQYWRVRASGLPLRVSPYEQLVLNTNPLVFPQRVLGKSKNANGISPWWRWIYRIAFGATPEEREGFG